MATINNSDTIKRILNDAKIQTSIDDVPNQLASKVVPVLIANPERIVNVIKNYNKANTGASTMYTTPTDKDFYLTDVWLSGSADVLYDGTSARITAIAEGAVAVDVLSHKNQTLTIFQNVFHNRPFNPPVKLERGSVIAVVLSFAAGTPFYTAGFSGYTVD